jgi:hypothetical protein
MRKLFILLLGPVLGLAISMSSHAEEAKEESPKMDHSGTATPTPGKEAGPGMMRMMGEKDMGKMHEMMQKMHSMKGECKKMHKDSKMCDADMMSTCQQKMGKMDCAKMMEQEKPNK